MEWTHEKPKEYGYYWYLDVADPVVVEYDSTGVWFFGCEGDDDIDSLDGEWYGPIQMPEVK